ncbi:hypothetical protein HYE36_06000 [Mycoplasmopsis bovis]|nr:hypothetical protein [Mycoplasmopsis bovis]WHL49576.1 hypothetical protein HYE36_06000 [Mycoplasmopsis bovis]
MYINSVRNWWGGADILQRRGLSANDEQKKKFDELAKRVGFDSYENAAIKGFSLLFMVVMAKLVVLDCLIMK